MLKTAGERSQLRKLKARDGPGAGPVPERESTMELYTAMENGDSVGCVSYDT